jgi:hypothetical protein
MNDGKELKVLAQDVSRQITGTFAKKSQIIVCHDHREIPALSVSSQNSSCFCYVN